MEKNIPDTTFKGKEFFPLLHVDKCLIENIQLWKVTYLLLKICTVPVLHTKPFFWNIQVHTSAFFWCTCNNLNMHPISRGNVIHSAQTGERNISYAFLFRIDFMPGSWTMGMTENSKCPAYTKITQGLPVQILFINNWQGLYKFKDHKINFLWISFHHLVFISWFF